MADYQKMYAVLCGAIDQVIDPLSRIPSAAPHARALQDALLRAEQLYVDTTPYLTETPQSNVIAFHVDCPSGATGNPPDAKPD